MVVEVDRRSEPIEGRVSAGTVEVAFAGWLELFRVIDEMLGSEHETEIHDGGK